MYFYRGVPKLINIRYACWQHDTKIWRLKFGLDIDAEGWSSSWSRNFCSDLEHKIWSRFWSSVDTFKPNFEICEFTLLEALNPLVLCAFGKVWKNVHIIIKGVIDTCTVQINYGGHPLWNVSKMWTFSVNISRHDICSKCYTNGFSGKTSLQSSEKFLSFARPLRPLTRKDKNFKYKLCNQIGVSFVYPGMISFVPVSFLWKCDTMTGGNRFKLWSVDLIS